MATAMGRNKKRILLEAYMGVNMFEELEKRVQRLERLIYLLIGLQIPDLLPYLGVL